MWDENCLLSDNKVDRKHGTIRNGGNCLQKRCKVVGTDLLTRSGCGRDGMSRVVPSMRGSQTSTLYELNCTSPFAHSNHPIPFQNHIDDS